MPSDSAALLHPDVLQVARSRGFASFTDVQVAAFPRILSGKNVLLMAPTGFGKTEAAMLPILSTLCESKGEGVQVLYITPLRALNRDMLARLKFFCKILRLKLGVRHGDTSAYERVKQRISPPDVLITTPESLGALLVSGMRDALKNVRFVVVDEVHELAYSKRGVQLNLALCRLGLLSKYHIVGLSATVAAPGDVAAFLGENVEVVDASVLRQMHLEAILPKEGAALEGLNRESAARLSLLAELVKKHRKTLVFVNTRFMAEALGALLRPLLGEEYAVHHSSLSKEARLEVEDDFKNGTLKALICTSSLELGMDIGDVDLVVQVGSPRQVTRLVQRVGRSGHKQHLVPKGVIVATGPLDFVEAEVLVAFAMKRFLEKPRPRVCSLDVLAHQLCGLAFDFGRIRLEGAVDVFRTRGHLYSSLTLPVARRVVEQLASEGNIAFDGEFMEPTKRTRFYYYENLSMIPDLKKFFVKNAETNKNVALLDEGFVSNYLQTGASFIARGRAWKVLSMAEDEIVVEPSRDVSAAVPDWVGEEIPVEKEVAAAVAGALRNASYGGLAAEQAPFFAPHPSQWVVEAQKNTALVHSFLGHKANVALANLLALSFSAKGKSVRIRAGAYSVLLEFSKPADAEAVASALTGLKGSSAHPLLRRHLAASPLFASRFVHVAKRFGFLRKDRDYSAVSVRRLAALMKDSVIAEEVFAELFYDLLDADALDAALSVNSVEVASFASWSPLAKATLDVGGFSEFYSAAEPTETVLAAFAGELAVKRVVLHCDFCKQRFSRTLGSLQEAKCIHCGSPRIFPEQYLAKPEQARVASIVASYGKNALLALGVYGVGPEAAARVLGRLHKSEKELLYDLLQQQKDFIRTKRFWKA